MATKRLEVRGMTCDSCGRHVTNALASAGAKDVEVDWRRGFATLDLADADEATLRDAVTDAGYNPGALAGADAAVLASVDGGTQTSEDRERYDLAILGSGSAAFAAAIRASDLGARVVMVEHGTTGGTCVNVGCVPSKALLRSAEVHREASEHRYPGLDGYAGDVDLARLVEAKQQLVETLRQEKYLDLIDAYGFDYRTGHASFGDGGLLTVDGQTLDAGKILIATGASPWAPPIPGLEETGYLTSTTALEVTDLPESLIVVGANAIGLELGQLFAFLGTKVTLIEALNRVAPFEEPEISHKMRDVLEEDGFEVHTGVEITSVRSEGRRKVVVADIDDAEHEFAASELLLATGRRPNTTGLGFEHAGVEVDDRGAILIDDHMRTSNPDIVAAGDVTQSPQFVYVAAAQGAKAAENALQGTEQSLDYDTLPRVTFTKPQIASAGLTEAQARERGLDVHSTTLPLDAVPRALVNRDTRGLIKVVAEEGTDRIVGVSALAEAAGEVIAGAVYVIKMKMTVQEVADTWSPYLTMAEGLKLAAQTFGRDVAKLSCCAA